MQGYFFEYGHEYRLLRPFIGSVIFEITGNDYRYHLEQVFLIRMVSEQCRIVGLESFAKKLINTKFTYEFFDERYENMAINKSKVIIRPEKPSEYEEVNKLIYEAFAEQHNIEIGSFMMEQYFSEAILNSMQDMALNHPVYMEYIIRTEKNGVMKDIWSAY